MYRIIHSQQLATSVKLFRVEARQIAKKCQPGQFVIVRSHEDSERIPLTIADFDREEGSITLIFQEVGTGTKRMGEIPAGGSLHDLAGPLGKPTHIENMGTVVCIGGGIGIAPVYPIARAFKAAGNRVISIIGARNESLLILENEMAAVSDELFITTDDGSRGRKGLVIHPLQELIDKGVKINTVMAIGPVIMMKSVAEVTRPYHIHTIVSLNPIMVDGTGMCGGCRVNVGNKSKFACVDGPEFNAHEVDFAGLMSRQRMYQSQEKQQGCQGGNGPCHG